MGDKVPNQYRQALVGGRSSADTRARTIRSALNAASLAMQAGAWESTTATEFGRDLAGHRRKLQSVATEERDTIDAKVATEEEKVEPNTWQATFYRLRKNLGPR